MKAYCLATGLPLVGVNHLEAHVNSNFCDLPAEAEGPNSGGPIAAIRPQGRMALQPSASGPCGPSEGAPEGPHAAGPTGGIRPPGRIRLQPSASGVCGPSDGAPEDFPALCLIVSGGHSDLVLLHSRRDHELLGCTRDDAAGEALDKAARVLELGYPGGPAIQRAAEQGTPRLDLPRPLIEGSLDYSFAGLKSALLRLVQQLRKEGELPLADLAASYQEAVVDTLVRNVRK
ncbi:MAG: hypothetical protein KKI08_03730, partial [Armatimonadetes bacterium]|nr:hypothetical protein [Armatimonadota bacterium]